MVIVPTSVSNTRARRCVVGQARDKFRSAVAETLTGWRLGCIPPRPGTGPETEIARAAIAEILALRLQIAYIPLFQGLARIEARVKVICDLREDPYAPPPKQQGALVQTKF